LHSAFACKEEKVAQKVIRDLVSDLDDVPADETVSFSLDGQGYEIDLSAGQAQEMRAELGPYVERARRQPRSQRRKRRASRDDLPDIRRFAAARGLPVKDRGKIPDRITEEYDEVMRISGKPPQAG
jgi:nucleoid-associated protein Lsr2